MTTPVKWAVAVIIVLAAIGIAYSLANSPSQTLPHGPDGESAAILAPKAHNPSAEESDSQPSTTDAPGWKTFTSQDPGFSVQYPPDWEAVTPGNPDTVLFVTSPERLFRVMSVDFYPDTSKDELLEQKAPPDPAMVRSTESRSIGGAQGTQRVVLGLDGATCFIDVYLESEANAFLVRYQGVPGAGRESECDNLVDPEFEQFVNSFRLR